MERNGFDGLLIFFFLRVSCKKKLSESCFLFWRQVKGRMLRVLSVLPAISLIYAQSILNNFLNNTKTCLCMSSRKRRASAQHMQQAVNTAMFRAAAEIFLSALSNTHMTKLDHGVKVPDLHVGETWFSWQTRASLVSK